MLESELGQGYSGAINPGLPAGMTMAAFIAIGWYNCIELNVRIMFMTFRQRRGLYFWSLLVSTWGVIFFSLSFLVKFFQVIGNDYISVTGITIGWWSMVTGQSLVLYSRLHLIMRDHQRLKMVLYMIIVDAILFHTPTSILTFGSNSRAAPEQVARFTRAYEVMEKIQLTAFCIQEFIISGLYVWETYKLMQQSEVFHQKKHTKKVMMHLIYVNVLIILMDITLLCTEYVGLYEIQITFKGALYSIKLKLEFSILNQLMDLARGSSGRGIGQNGGDASERGTSDYSRSGGRRTAVPLYTMGQTRAATGQHGDDGGVGGGGGGGVGGLHTANGHHYHPGGLAIGAQDEAGEEGLASPVLGYSFAASRGATEIGPVKGEKSAIMRTTEVVVTRTGPRSTTGGSALNDRSEEEDEGDDTEEEEAITRSVRISVTIRAGGHGSGTASRPNPTRPNPTAGSGPGVHRASAHSPSSSEMEFARAGA